jgi:hypothetical protein
MNELTDNINPVNNPEQAVAEFVGEQFIEWLMNYITVEIGKWPAIKLINSIRTKPEKIKKFMLQRFLAAQAFSGERDDSPGFLRFAIANLSESNDPAAESALGILEKKHEEGLAGQNAQLWQRLLLALGAVSEEIQRTEPKEPTRNYTAELSEVYSSSDWQTAMGAFAAYERAVMVEYQAILKLLKNNTGLTDKDLEIIFVFAGSTSDYPANANHVLDKIVFDHETKLLIWGGVRRLLSAQLEFLNGLVRYLEDKKLPRM